MFETGVIEPFWNTQHTLLMYKDVQFNNPVDLEKWKSLGFAERKSIGQTFDMKNIMPGWTTPFSEIFKGSNIGVSFFKMRPGDFLPRHCDTYQTYIKVNNIDDPRKIHRAIIFLEDWKPGHILEVNDVPFTKWSAGQYVVWQYDTPHLAANLGFFPRYTAQITFTKDV